LPRRRCYPSDTFDDEWALIESLLPIPACDTRTGGRPEKHPRREIVDAIRYVVDTGCKWRGPAQGLSALAHVLRIHGPLGGGRSRRADP
jgi:transposase